MKKKIVILLLAFALIGSVFAQTPEVTEFDQLQNTFQGFADAIAPVLPFNSTIGLNWSDAYIGSLFALPPHLGAGVTLGFTTIPYEAMKPVLELFGPISLPDKLKFIEKIGIPLPAYTAEARIGGLLLPFDIGVKVGVVPKALVNKLTNGGFEADYILAGADIRYALVKENFILPDISIGVGLNYLQTNLILPGLLGSDIEISQVEVPNEDGTTTTYSLGFKDPQLQFGWKSTVFDFKLEVSKSLLIITPYLGVGATVGKSEAGGGLTSKPVVKDSSGNEVANQDEIISAISQFAGVDLTDVGITVNKEVSGWSFRAFGGVSLNLLILKIDLTGLYNFIGKNYGLSLNARLQL